MNLKETIDYFWREYKDALPKDAEVYVNQEPVSGLVKTCLDHEVTFPYNSAYFFFIDLEPEANWMHDCVYVFVMDNKFSYVRHTEPPMEMTGLMRTKKRINDAH